MFEEIINSGISEIAIIVLALVWLADKVISLIRYYLAKRNGGTVKDKLAVIKDNHLEHIQSDMRKMAESSNIAANTLSRIERQIGKVDDKLDKISEGQTYIKARLNGR